MMEVEHSANSGCFGVFERRRETSTMEEKEEIRAAIHGLFTSSVKMWCAGFFSDQWPLRVENGVIARLAAAEARKRRRLRVENAAETIHAFMRSARAREERERITRRAAAKARKRAKVAARRERMRFGRDLDGSAEADALSGGDVKLAGDAISGGDAITAKQRKQVKLGGDAVLASEGDKCESFSGDGTGLTFFGGDANVGGDNDEKYEEDFFSIAELPPATWELDRMFGTCFANVNIARAFLYYHYEYVKRDFG